MSKKRRQFDRAFKVEVVRLVSKGRLRIVKRESKALNIFLTYARSTTLIVYLFAVGEMSVPRRHYRGESNNAGD